MQSTFPFRSSLQLAAIELGKLDAAVLFVSSMTIKGITYLVLALLVFAVQDSIVKHLTVQYEVVQILTWRILVVVIIVGSIARYKLGASFLQTKRKAMMFLRGVCAFAAFLSYYFALSYLPLADAATVFMTAPLFVTALSVPFLGEQVGLHRWCAVLVGFSAVVIMLNPGSELFQPIAMLPLVSALFYSFIPIITRQFDEEERTLTIVFYTAFSYALMCVILSFLVHLFPATIDDVGIWGVVAQPWKTINAAGWFLVLITAGMFTTGILLITAAYRCTEVSILAPFEYSYLLWATLIGYFVFFDTPSLQTIFAACVIAGCGIYIAIRERYANHQ